MADPSQPRDPSLPRDDEPGNPAPRPLIAPPWSPVASVSASYVPRPRTAAPEPSDGRSFTERYRGTQWDTSPLVGLPAGDAMPARRSGPSILLLAGAGMLLAVVALIGVMLYTNSQQPAFLPAAVLPGTPALETPPSATAPSPVANSPSLAPTAPASQPPATQPPPAPTAAPVTSPTPTAPLLLPDDPAGAFVARMMHGASYSVEADGQFDFGGDRGSWGYAMDVSGRDLTGVFNIDQKRLRIVSDIIVKDGVQYNKPAGEGWARQEGVPEGMPMDIFDTTRGPQSWEGLEYVGTATRKRTQLHHLRLPAALLPELSAMWIDQYEGGLVLHDFSFDLWITEDGRPRSADVAFDGTVRSDGVEVDMTFNMEYRFTRWGEPIVIQAPAQYTDPGYTDG